MYHKMLFNVFIYLTALSRSIKQSNCLRGAIRLLLAVEQKFEKFRSRAAATQLHFKPSEKFSAQLIIALHFTGAQSLEQEKTTAQRQAAAAAVAWGGGVRMDKPVHLGPRLPWRGQHSPSGRCVVPESATDCCDCFFFFCFSRC